MKEILAAMGITKEKMLETIKGNWVKSFKEKEIDVEAEIEAIFSSDISFGGFPLTEVLSVVEITQEDLTELLQEVKEELDGVDS